MTYPKAYEPEEGYRYHILCRSAAYGREWEHCDYAKDYKEKGFLIGEYRMSYGLGWEFKSFMIPAKYWRK